MDTFCITFNFEEAIALSDAPPLFDDIIAAAAVNEATNNGTLDDDFSVINELPIENWKADDTWGYMASYLMFEWYSPVFNTAIRGRTNVNSIVELKNSGLLNYKSKNLPDTSRGAYKNYDLRLFHRYAEKAKAYCIGDAERIEELLMEISHIGPKRRLGFGKIADFNIEKIKNSDEWMHRPLPISMRDNGKFVAYNPRPPYWFKKTPNHDGYIMQTLPDDSLNY